MVTTRSVYVLGVDRDPISACLDSCANCGGGGNYFDNFNVEKFASAFGLDTKMIMELAADIRLCEADIAGAISLYRQAGCKHLKVHFNLILV